LRVLQRTGRSRRVSRKRACAVGDVDEVVASQELAEVGGDIEAEEELLEVGPMVLVEAEGDARLGVGRPVLATEGVRRGVEVDPAGVELEALDEAQREAKEDVSPSLGGERIQHSSLAVVVDGRLLGFG
jgi:hypothetical protein